MSEKMSTDDFKEKVFDFEAGENWNYRGELPAIIDFWAEWCPPCKMVSPVLEAISQEYSGKLKVYKVNTDEEPELSAVFGIHSIPVLMFIPKTGEPRMSVGALPKTQILKAMRDVMAVE